MGVDDQSDAAYRRGYSQGTDDAEHAVSTATPTEFQRDLLYQQGYEDGVAAQQAAMAGFAAGIADERGHVDSAVPTEHQGSQSYADAYEMGQATAAGYDAGVADAHDHVSSLTPPEFAGSATYANAYEAGQATTELQEKEEADRVEAYRREIDQRLADEKARRPFEHMNDPDSIYYQKPETPEERQQRLAEEARLRESEENQQVMWSDGSVSTRKEHEAREFREGLEQIETLGGVGELHNPHGVGGGTPAE